MSTPSQSEEPKARAPPRPQQYSPFLNEMLSNWIPAHEKGLRTGFYNSISLIFLLLVLIVIYYCYWVLKPFLQALVWALLCGSALHPFKRRFLICSVNWISDVKNVGRPICLETLLLPLKMVKHSTDCIIEFLCTYKKIILMVLVPVVVNHFVGQFWIHNLEMIYSWIITFIDWIPSFSTLTNPNNTFVIITLTIGYLIALSFGWSESTKIILSFLSPFVWFSVLINITFLCGTVGKVVAILLLAVIIIGLIQTLIGEQSGSDQTDGLENISLRIKDRFKSIANFVMNIFIHSKEHSNIESEDKVFDDSSSQESSAVDSNISRNLNPKEHISRRSSLESNSNGTHITSNRYLYTVLWAVVVVQLCSNTKFILLLIIPMSLKMIMLIFKYSLPLIDNNVHRFKEFIENRNEALFHPSIRLIYRFFLVGDRVICNTIEASMSALTSLSVILITIISFTFIGIFISIQIYGESIHIINSASNILNETIRSYPESGQLLPHGFNGIDEILDQMVRNGYEYGREYIKSFVQNSLHVNDNTTRAVEKQILEIWDRAYHLWLIRNVVDAQDVPKKGPYDFNKLYNALTTLDLSLCFNIVKENIDTLLSVLESVWLVLKGNISLLLSAITAVISILLGGGLGLMNLFISFIIFTTALFYLLSASGEQYKPIELVNRLFPSETSGQSPNRSSITTKFGRAVEEAVNGVFAASLKMSAFYGLYTYLIHVLFDVNIVYIPSVMASILGAVPFLSAFWASFPAALELFFAHKQRTKAILLLISAYFPSLFVDSTIYGEIESAGHPYLTGLAIAGGVFYLGFEGAIFGPMLLCFLFVAFNMYTSIMEESPVKSNMKTTHLRRLQSLI